MQTTKSSAEYGTVDPTPIGATRVPTAEEVTSRDTLLLSIYPNLNDSGWWFLLGKSGVCHSERGFATAADAAKAAAECIESFSANPAKFVTERAGE